MVIWWQWSRKSPKAHSIVRAVCWPVRHPGMVFVRRGESGGKGESRSTRGGDCSSLCRRRRADQISLVARELRRAQVECFGRLCGAACWWTRPWCCSWCPGRVPSDAAELIDSDSAMRRIIFLLLLIAASVQSKCSVNECLLQILFFLKMQIKTLIAQIFILPFWQHNVTVTHWQFACVSYNSVGTQKTSIVSFYEKGKANFRF